MSSMSYIPAALGIEPSPPIPTQRQLVRQAMELCAFAHFGPNTFTDLEWGHGTENPLIFNPKNLDCGQWVRAFKAAGMKGVVITAKHHDGFCLWPSEFSSHSVARSPWRDGKGDVLRELSEACGEEDFGFGFYLSPWDRNHPDYGTPQYNQTFASMLREILTGYGPVFEVWFDGAKGQGPDEKPQEYDWNLYIETVRECQPEAVIFSDFGPDLRWVGNEDGYAAKTNWAMIDRSDYYPGTPKYDELTEGHEQGVDYVPTECDVSIRPGWFWHEAENSQVKPVEKLLDIYFGSVGQAGTLLLNVPPNAEGLIDEVDVQRLYEFRQSIDKQFSNPVLAVSATADGEREGCEAANAIDGSPHTIWAAPEGSSQANITLELGESKRVNRLVLREPVQFGQRVKRFEVHVERESGWQLAAEGTTIGHQRFLVLPQLAARRVRVAILDTRADPLIGEISLYQAD